MFWTFASWVLIIVTLSVDIWSVVRADTTPQASTLQYFGLFRARGNAGKNFYYTDNTVPLAPLDTLQKAGSGSFVMLFVALLLTTLAFILMAMILNRKLEMDSGVLTLMFFVSAILCLGAAACWFGAAHFVVSDTYDFTTTTTYIGGSLVMAVVTGAFVCYFNGYLSNKWKSQLNTSATI